MKSYIDKILHPEPKKLEKRSKLVVLGSGWASLAFVKDIDKRLYDVVVISPRNNFLFTPMLGRVATGEIDDQRYSNLWQKYCKYFVIAS
jgi:NADH dehydrogenase FAD-containing subunit